MRVLKDVIDQILAVSTNEALNAELKGIQYDIGFTAPENMPIQWNLTSEALQDHIPNPAESDETLEILSIFSTMPKEEIRKATQQY